MKNEFGKNAKLKNILLAACRAVGTFFYVFFMMATIIASKFRTRAALIESARVVAYRSRRSLFFAQISAFI